MAGGKVDTKISNRKTAATTNNDNNNKNFISGIFIKHVLDNSPAGASGLLKTGDRILQVNGIDLTSSSHDNAVCVIRNARSPIHFLIQSLLGGPTTNNNNNTVSHCDRYNQPVLIVLSICVNLTIKQQAPSTTSSTTTTTTDQSRADDDYPFDEPNKFNYNLSDVRDKYSHLDGQVSIVQLKRKSQHESLGISLSGNLNLTKASVFICSMCEESLAAKSGLHKVGDQIIEVSLCGF
jgi:multiple PDZ domain protein